MRIVLDANIFVSAVISPSGLCSQIIQHITQNSNLFELVLSPLISEEIYRSLTRPRILLYSKKSAPEMMSWLESLDALALQVTDAQLLSHSCRDPDDDKYLSAAITANAHTIVSGDKDLLVLKEIGGILIMTPRDFYKKLFPSPATPPP